MALLCKATRKPSFPKRQSVWPVKENKSSYRLINAEAYNVCWIENESYVEKRSIPHADHIFLTCKDTADRKKIAIVVELKGKDVDHGYQQIASTISTMGSFFDGYLVLARMVATKTPRITQKARVRDAMIRLLKEKARNIGVKVDVSDLYHGHNEESLPKLYRLLDS